MANFGASSCFTSSRARSAKLTRRHFIWSQVAHAPSPRFEDDQQRDQERNQAGHHKMLIL
jgi:hypothetical protein